MAVDYAENVGAPMQAGARLGAGLVQGFALYLLFRAADAHVWPATHGQLFAPLLFVALAAPVVFVLGIGNLRPRTLGFWLASATAVVAFLAWYDIWHGWPVTLDRFGPAPGGMPRIEPAPQVFAGAVVVLFIAHALVWGGDQDRRFRASYPTHFDVAWKLALQLLLAAGFVLVFWGLLVLGAGLFELVRLHFFRRLIAHDWFYFPVTALAVAAALHVTDVNPALVRGARTLVLTLLSWLLPVMAAIAVSFLASLLVTGLEPLWQTRFAARLLLVAAAALVVLINAAYREGRPVRTTSAALRLGGRAAALALGPIACLAAYALALRVGQYGWTAARIALAAAVAVALVYAAGYAVAAFRRGPWLRFIEVWNFAAALFVLATLLAYFSPIADPARISVRSQVARLAAGRVAPEAFDFAYLRWHGGRFGKAALEALSRRERPAAATVRRAAAAALNAKPPYERLQAPTPEGLAEIPVYPPGRRLPASFTEQDWHAEPSVVPSCLRVASPTLPSCDAYLVDLDADGRDEIVILEQRGGAYADSVFAQAADGRWQRVGALGRLWSCPSVQRALKAGQFDVVPPPPPHWKAVQAAGVRLTVTEAPSAAPCPE